LFWIKSNFSEVVSANSFYHTCRYITNKPGAEVLEVEGGRGHSFKLMAADFESQHLLRPDKQAACFHGILSFYPGEKPSDAMMKEIARKYLEQLGIVNTQYAISKHTDKAHLHLHIVANMVNPIWEIITGSQFVIVLLVLRAKRFLSGSPRNIN
jgi:hypothetical protein